MIYEWIANNDASPINVDEGRKDLKVVEAAYLSAQAGNAVDLPLQDAVGHREVVANDPTR